MHIGNLDTVIINKAQDCPNFEDHWQYHGHIDSYICGCSLCADKPITYKETVREYYSNKNQTP